MLEQIESLRKTIDRQGEMITRLLEAVAASQDLRSRGGGKGSDNDQAKGTTDANGDERSGDVFGGSIKSTI